MDRLESLLKRDRLEMKSKRRDNFWTVSKVSLRPNVVHDNEVGAANFIITHNIWTQGYVFTVQKLSRRLISIFPQRACDCEGVRY